MMKKEKNKSAAYFLLIPINPQSQRNKHGYHTFHTLHNLASILYLSFKKKKRKPRTLSVNLDIVQERKRKRKTFQYCSIILQLGFRWEELRCFTFSANFTNEYEGTLLSGIRFIFAGKMSRDHLQGNQGPCRHEKYGDSISVNFEEA